MEAKCCWGDCTNPPKFQVEMRIWAVATPLILRTEKNCLKLLGGICLCETHVGDFKVENMLLPEGKERIANACSLAGKAAPDFTSAKLNLIEIVGEPIDVRQQFADAKRRGAPTWEA